MSLAVRTDSLYSVRAQPREHGMHIVTCLCCNLFGLLGGDLPLLCFQGKKTRTLDDKKLLPRSHFFLSRLFLFVCVRWNIALLKTVTITKGQTCEKTLENNTEFT